MDECGSVSLRTRGSSVEMNSRTVLQNQFDVAVGGLIADQEQLVWMRCADAKRSRDRVVGPVGSVYGNGNYVWQYHIPLTVYEEACTEVDGVTVVSAIAGPYP